MFTTTTLSDIRSLHLHFSGGGTGSGAGSTTTPPNTTPSIEPIGGGTATPTTTSVSIMDVLKATTAANHAHGGAGGGNNHSALPAPRSHNHNTSSAAPSSSSGVIGGDRSSNNNNKSDFYDNLSRAGNNQNQYGHHSAASSSSSYTTNVQPSTASRGAQHNNHGGAVGSSSPSRLSPSSDVRAAPAAQQQSHQTQQQQQQQAPPRRKQRDYTRNQKLDIRTHSRKVLGRLIIVGDVHGCPDQLRDLAKSLNYDPSFDLMIIAGDIVNKGPDSEGAVRAALDLKALAVMGNHDLTVLDIVDQIKSKEIDPFSKKYSRDPVVRVARGLSDECIHYLQNLPHVLRIPQYNLIVLHAGINLSYRLEEQTVHDLTHLRRLDWDPERMVYDGIAKGDHGQLWAQLYKGPETIVFGHDARTGFQMESHAIGLDTGCCYGGKLTAVVYPGKKIVSVPGLPRDAFLGAEEDFDETVARLDTPPQQRELSPAPSSFYDPVPFSNQSTPHSATYSSVDGAFPMAPAVEQLFQKHRQQQLHHFSTFQSPPTSSGELPPSTLTAAAIELKMNSAPQTPVVDRQPSYGIIHASRTSPSSAAAPAVALTSQAIGDAASTPSSSSWGSQCAVQFATLTTLIQGQHALAVLELLRTNLYRTTWSLLMEHLTLPAQQQQSSAAVVVGSTSPSEVFWSAVVEMIIAYTDREKNLTDPILELVELLLEVLHEKREFLTSKAVARVSAFSSRLDVGDFKGISKSVLKSIKLAMK